MISDLHYYPWGYYPKYGVLGLPFLAFFFGTMALSLYEFSAEFKKTGPGTHKLRVKSFMVGFGVASLGSIDYFAKYGVPIYPFGYLPIFVFFIIAVQTIRRYRLVDITPAFVADQIIATMADSLIVCDAEGKIRLVNPTACSILGYSRTELLGKPMASFLAAARAHRFGGRRCRGRPFETRKRNSMQKGAGGSTSAFPSPICATRTRAPRGSSSSAGISASEKESRRSLIFWRSSRRRIRIRCSASQKRG
ncbi:MAG: PAS domain S-box protein [Candidatus Manganitrophus sp.]|nr:MAG: PAS domain S-box protein [Candidatus Manganitrophus sp.]